MKKHIYIFLAVALAGMAATITVQQATIRKRTEQRDIAQRNTDALINDVEHYRISDSLSAIEVGSLTLSLKEYEKYRSEDAALISQLRGRQKDLESIISTQTKTITRLENIPIRDSIVYIAGTVDTIRCMSYSDQWLDFVGCENGTISITTRDELLITTSVEYRRALGFLWRTKKVKSQSSSAVSKNPHTEITDMEHIIISK